MELILKNVKKKIYHFKIVGKSLGLNWKENKPYNPEFVKEILEAAKEVREEKN
jgi:hypothetical protein